MDIAERMFQGEHAKAELEEKMGEAAPDLDYSRIGFDEYDDSLELHEVPDDFRLSAGLQKVIYGAGFAKVYVNHSNKWETHYSWGRNEFKATDGWRVSYPRKRGPNETSIWVEEHIAAWPANWFDTGYVIVKPGTEVTTGQMKKEGL